MLRTTFIGALVGLVIVAAAVFVNWSLDLLWTSENESPRPEQKTFQPSTDYAVIDAQGEQSSQPSSQVNDRSDASFRPPQLTTSRVRPLLRVEPDVAKASSEMPQEATDLTTGSALSGPAQRVPTGWCFRPYTAFDYPERLKDSSVSEIQTGSHIAMASDSSVTWEGLRSVSISGRGTPSGSAPGAVLWQTIDARPFRGTKVRFSAFVRSQVGQYAQVYLLTAYSTGPNEAISANGVNAAIADRQDWSQVAIGGVVPAEALVLTYGFVLYGAGEMWVDDTHFGSTTADTTTGGTNVVVLHAPANMKWVLSIPSNLDFETTVEVTDDVRRKLGCQ